MADYQESTLTGQAWQRCHQIVIDHRRGVTPTVRFDEERVVALDDGSEVRTPRGTLTLDYDPARLIPLRDPLSGEPTGETVSYAAAYQLLYSAYLDAALARDAAQQAAEPLVPVEPEE
jgi:hypothetical protein